MNEILLTCCGYIRRIILWTFIFFMFIMRGRWRDSSAGQSSGIIIHVSGVQVPLPLPKIQPRFIRGLIFDNYDSRDAEPPRAGGSNKQIGIWEYAGCGIATGASVYCFQCVLVVLFFSFINQTAPRPPMPPLPPLPLTPRPGAIAFAPSFPFVHAPPPPPPLPPEIPVTA